MDGLPVLRPWDDDGEVATVDVRLDAMASCTTCDRDQAYLRRRRRPSTKRASEAITIVDLFCGAGGLSLGFTEAARRLGLGTRIGLALDADEEAVAVYQDNFRDAHVVHGFAESLFDGDLGARLTRTELRMRAETGSLSMLIAGPPCQGHSDLNNHTRRRDVRNALYLRLARAAEVLRPEVLLVENVPAVLRDRSDVVAIATAALHSAGFDVADAVVELVDVGVPQRRRRHILLAARRDLLDPKHVLENLGSSCAEHSERSVRWAIGDLLNGQPRDGYDQSSSASAANRARMNWLFANDVYDLPNEERPPCHRDKDHSYVSMYGRLRWDAPAQTITTGFGSMGQGRFVHPARRRTLTPHEAARLQTFPDYFSFRNARTSSALRRMIGNAVPPLLGVSLGMALIPRLSEVPVGGMTCAPRQV